MAERGDEEGDLTDRPSDAGETVEWFAGNYPKEIALRIRIAKVAIDMRNGLHLRNGIHPDRNRVERHRSAWFDF